MTALRFRLVICLPLFAIALILLAVRDPGPASADSNPQPNERALQRVIQVHDRNTDRLLSLKGVVGTAVGLTAEGKLVVKVYTAKQGVRRIPRSLERVPVIVEVTGEFIALPKPPDKPGKGGGGSGGNKDKVDPTSRFPRPVPTGVSTGNQGSCSAGTIACRVTKDNAVFALSNNHVFALENIAGTDDAILQPGRFDTDPQCAFVPGDVIGALTDYVPIDFVGGDNKVDAAIALSSTEFLGIGTPSDGYGVPKSATVSATLNQKVQKYGRTTSLTKGQVTGINASVYVGYSSGTALFVDQIIVQARKPFIKAGDSGSLLVTDPGRNPVGLLYAGTSDGKLAVANRIDLVLDAFDVTIDGE